MCDQPKFKSVSTFTLCCMFSSIWQILKVHGCWSISRVRHTVFPRPATWEVSPGLWKVLRSLHLSLCSSPALSQHWEAWGTLRSQITGHYTSTGEATKAPDNRATEWRYSNALFEMEESDMQRERERSLPFRGFPDWPATSEFKHSPKQYWQDSDPSERLKLRLNYKGNILSIYKKILTQKTLF